VESLLTTHGPQILDKVDVQVDMLQAKGMEKYGNSIKKATEVVSYAKETKDGVVNYAMDKKTAVYDTATKTTETARNRARDIASKVQSGELKQTLMKEIEKQPVAASMANRVFTLLAIATAYTGSLKTKADGHVATAKGLYTTWCVKAKQTADSMLAKLPVAAAQEKVAKVEKQVRALVQQATEVAKPYAEKVQAKTAPLMEQLTPYVSKAKTEASKVYVKLMEYKATFTKKQA
jgi:gas vesicle protein